MRQTSDDSPVQARFAAVTCGVALGGAAWCLAARLLPKPVSTWIVIAQAIAFPRVLATGLAIGFVTTVVILGWRWRQTSAVARAWGACAALACAVASAVWATTAGNAPTIQADATHGQALTIVTWNTQRSLSPSDMATLIDRYNPDVFVLSETSREQATAALAHLDRSAEFEVFTSPSRSITGATTVVVHVRLGKYREVDTTSRTMLGSLRLEPADNTAMPAIIGVHTIPPLTSYFDRWADDVALAVELSGCASDHPPTTPTITAGDFNATLQHGAMAYLPHCTDLLSASASNYDATWRSDWPRWVGTTIDHTLVTNDITPIWAEVVDVGSSDHRAVISKIGLPAPIAD